MRERLSRSERRMSNRRSTNLAALGGGWLQDQFFCRVSEMSYGGCRIVTERHVRSGSNLSLTIPSLGTIATAVVWQDGSEAGLRFLD